MRRVLSRAADALRWRLSGSAGPPLVSEPRRAPTDTYQGFDGLPVAADARGMGGGRTLLVHHPSPGPPAHEGLAVMSYNIFMGGRRREALEAYFAQLGAEGRLPDVVGLQEVSQEVAVALARRHGFHLAYHGAAGGGAGQRLVNGKAVLSRHPLREAAHFTYTVPAGVRSRAEAHSADRGELEEDRGALRVLLDVRGRRVALYDVHHALSDPGVNAGDLQQLLGLLREDAGLPVVVLGDFNANTLVRRDGSWVLAHLRRYEPTHTVEEYQARYGDVWSSVGDKGVGNIGDWRIRRALRALRRRHPEAFSRAPEVWVRLPDGTRMSPAQARRQLRSGRVEKGSERWRRLQDVADTATLTSEPDERGVVPATGKRFDALYASRTLRPRWVEVDRTTRASDHQPVLAAFRLG